MFQHLNHRCARHRKQEQEVENLFEKIMKNFPNVAKQIRLPRSPGSSESPKKLDPKRNTPRHIIITLAKIKDKERILKAVREKETVTYLSLIHISEPTRL